MGIPQSTTQTLVETTCATSYGPRQLRTIPTTTRETRTTYTVTTRSDRYDIKYEKFPPTTFIVTQPAIITIVETAAEPTGATTSTMIIFDTSTAYYDTTQTDTALILQDPVTSASPPYNVPTPFGFTPLAFNPANAGANALEIAKTSASVGTNHTATSIVLSAM